MMLIWRFELVCMVDETVSVGPTVLCPRGRVYLFA